MLAKNRQRHVKKYAYKVKLNVYLKYPDTCMLTNVCLQCINKYMLTMYWKMYTNKILTNVWLQGHDKSMLTSPDKYMLKMFWQMYALDVLKCMCTRSRQVYAFSVLANVYLQCVVANVC